jgi:hypothetical protein
MAKSLLVILVSVLFAFGPGRCLGWWLYSPGQVGFDCIVFV